MMTSNQQQGTSYPVDEMVKCHHAVEGELDLFLQRHLSLRSAQLVNPQFYNVARDYIMRPSKRLVALVYLLTHNLFEPSSPIANQNVLPVTVTLEIRHAAILIHDDVVDQDERRGPILAAHKALEYQGYGKDGSSAAIFLADSLFALSERGIIDANLEDARKVYLLRQLADMTAWVAEGQADELYLTNSYSIEEMPVEKLRDTYIAKMSPTTIESSMVLGAITGGANELVLQTIRAFCRPISLAYQIQNDIAGYENLLKVYQSGGKFMPLASTTDFDRRRKTILLKVARDLSSDKGRLAIDEFVMGEERVSVTDVLDVIAASGAVDQLRSDINSLFLKGREVIQQSDSDETIKSGLLRICRFMDELYDGKSPLSRIQILAHPELEQRSQ